MVHVSIKTEKKTPNVNRLVLNIDILKSLYIFDVVACQ